MKKLCMILSLALILCFMVSCQDKEAMAELEAMKAQAEVEEQNKELMRNYFKELDKGNAEIFREVYAPDAAYYFPSGITEPMSLEQEIEQFLMNSGHLKSLASLMSSMSNSPKPKESLSGTNMIKRTNFFWL